MTSAFNDIDDLLTEYEDMADVGHPQSATKIEEAESRLGVRFPETYKEFLKKWGTISFGPKEYLGIGSGTSQDAVEFTLKKRKAVGLPDNLVIVCDNEGDEYICLDTSNLNDQGECPVIGWDVPTSQPSRKKSDRFDEYLLQDIKDFIE